MMTYYNIYKDYRNVLNRKCALKNTTALNYIVHGRANNAHENDFVILYNVIVASKCWRKKNCHNKFFSASYGSSEVYDLGI